MVHLQDEVDKWDCGLTVVSSNVNSQRFRQDRPQFDEPIWRYDALSIGLSGDDDSGLDEG